MGCIGFIGAGNMAEALIRGIIGAGVYSPADIIVSDVLAERVKYLADEYEVGIAKGNVGLTEAADVVVLSVKPQKMNAVLAEIKGAVNAGAVVISIAAGVSVDKIVSALGDAQVIRVMPNTPALIGQGASGLFTKNASERSMQKALEIFSAIGIAVVVESEDLIDAVTAVSGSGPAYFFLLMEEMIKSAQSLGLDSDTARTLVLQTPKGAALLAEDADARGETPKMLREKVTSPGGTTQAAIETFVGQNFSEIVTAALTAARARSRELAG